MAENTPSLIADWTPEKIAENQNLNLAKGLSVDYQSGVSDKTVYDPTTNKFVVKPTAPPPPTITPPAPTITPPPKTPTPIEQATSDEVTALRAQAARQDADIARTQTEFDNYTKDIAAIDAENSPIIQNIKDTFARRAAETAQLNTAMQGQVGLAGQRSGLARYAPQMQSGLISAETTNGINRLADLDTKKIQAIQAAKDALKSEAKDKWSTFNTFMQQASNAYKEKTQTVIDIANTLRDEEDRVRNQAKSDLELQKLQQEIITSNLDTYASGFVDFDESGNIAMETPDNLRVFAEESGIPYAQVVGAVRKKAYELSKLSDEDRKRTLEIEKLQRDAIPSLFQEFEYAQKNYGFTGSFQDYSLSKKETEQSLPSSFREWQLAGGELGTGVTYADFIKSSGAAPKQYQFTAANYASRLSQSGEIISKLDNDFVGLKSVAGEYLPNILKSSKRQQLEQAQKNFLNAVLRRESGAVISDTEFANGRQQYFPIPGDSKAVLEQKKQNRDLVTRNFIREAGPALSETNPQLLEKGVNYINVSDFSKNATQDELNDFNSLKNTFPNKTPQELFEFYREEQSFSKPQAMGKNSPVAKVVSAIGQYESGGNYQARGPVVTSGQYKGEQAVGKYQIMPGNISSWTKEALGYSLTPQQFLNNPEAQDNVAEYKMNQYYKKYGNVEDVASVWFSGRPVKQAGQAKDVIGTTTPQYVKNVVSIYNKLT